MTKRGMIALALIALLPGIAGAAQLPALKPVGSIPIPDGPWDYAAVDAAARRLYLSRGDGVLLLNLDTGKVTPTLVPGKRVHQSLPLPNGRLLSTNGESNTATLSTASDGSVIAEIPTGQKPDAAVYDPVSKLVLVMNGKSGDVTLIDPASAKSVGTIAVGGALEYAVADGLGHVFVNVEDKSELVTIDTAGHKVTGTSVLTGCEEPTGLAYDAQDKLLLSACGNKVAIISSAVTGKALATVVIGAGPDAAIWDDAAKLFYVPCGGDGILSVIAVAGGKFTALGSIPTHKGARLGALDPKTGRIYLPTADYQAAAPGERPKAVAGSARLMVLGTN